MRRLVQLFEGDRLVPSGVRQDDVVYAPNLAGRDMDTALGRIASVVAAAGASLDNVARVTAYVRTVEEREPVYQPWDRLFPDPADRPAFKVLLADLPQGVNVRLDMLARRGARRRRIDLDGVPARDPTVVVGDWVCTSRVHGTDPATGQLAQPVEREAEQAFANVRRLAELGGRPADAAQLTVFVADPANARLAQGQHVVQTFIPSNLALMVELLAAPVREVYTTDSAVPDAVWLEDLLYAPALDGNGPDFETQLRDALARMQRIVDPSQVAHVSVYMSNLDLKPVLNAVWSELYSDPLDRPPHKYVPVELPGQRHVQLQVFGIRGARRQVLEIPGMAHGDPMSMGARLGDYVFSSRIVGWDPATGQTPPDPKAQVDHAFRNVQTLLSRAGSARLSQLTAFINDDLGRQLTERTFETSFPEADLHFLNAHLPGSTAVRLEVIAS
jgi:enamine deaminase RidA (YjgF/YER057c/UK114 family)